MDVGDERDGVDAILFWNEVALEAHRRDFTFTDAFGEDETDAATDRLGLHPEHVGIPAASRILAMVHLAIYDAWHALSPTGGAAYVDRSEPSPAGSADAAVAGAALAVLSGVYVRQQNLFDTKCRQHLATLSDRGVSPAAVAAGYRLGRDIGLAMLQARAEDGATATDCPASGDAPGLSRPDPFEPVPPAGTAWGNVEFFGLGVLDRVRTAARAPWGFEAPDGFLASPAYRRDLAEVASVGGAANAAGVRRTPQQTVTGLFWAYDGSRNIGTAPRLYNQCVRAISATCRLQPRQNAVLFALANMAMADAGIAAWSGKCRFRVWRPIHGIREAAVGYGLSQPPRKAATPLEPPAGDIADWLARTPPELTADTSAGGGDPFWRPFGMARTNAPGQFHRTPASPAYPSGHATLGAACFDVVFRFLCAVVGMTAAAARQLTFTIVSDEFSGRAIDADGSLRPRHVRTLTLGQAIRENALGRLYLGVNWRSAIVEGVRLGLSVVSGLTTTGRGPATVLAVGPGAGVALHA